MVAHPLIEGIHSIGAQAKSYIPWVIAEFFVLLIDPLPLTIISRVCNLIIIHLALIIPYVMSAASLGFRKIHLKRSVAGRYHNTKAGILLCFALLPNEVSSRG